MIAHHDPCKCKYVMLQVQRFSADAPRALGRGCPLAGPCLLLCLHQGQPANKQGAGRQMATSYNCQQQLQATVSNHRAAKF